MSKDFKHYTEHKQYNGVPVLADEVLVPVVLTPENKQFYLSKGLIEDNCRYIQMPNGKKVLVCFVAMKKEVASEYMKYFYKDIKSVISGTDIYDPKDINILSLDEYMEDLLENDGIGYDFTATTKYEDDYKTNELYEDVSNRVDDMLPHAKEILDYLLEGYSKREVFEHIDLNKGKTQSYEYINKVMGLFKELLIKEK